MYQIFKNSKITSATQINDFNIANEAKLIFSDFKNLSVEQIISKLKLTAIQTYNSGYIVLIDKK